MRVAIAGAHGQIARHLARRLSGAGHEVVGIIRNPDHAEDLRADGAEPVVVDLESATAAELAAEIDGADAVVFAAGAGPNSGVERKTSMDRDGAILLRDGASAAGIHRYVMVSSTGTEDPPQDDDVMSVYLRAKRAADDAVMGSDLEWTIVRPGRLTDDEPTGDPKVSTEPERGEVSREDVALVLARVLEDPASVGQVLYVN